MYTFPLNIYFCPSGVDFICPLLITNTFGVISYYILCFYYQHLSFLPHLLSGGDDVFIDRIFYINSFIFLFRATPMAFGTSQARAESELQLLACTTATATWDLSRICDLYHNSWKICFHCTMMGTPSVLIFISSLYLHRFGSNTLY